MNDALKSAIRAALRANEIGERTPYELSFAAKGKSGASFGAMQGDMSAGPAYVRTTLSTCLKRSGFNMTEIESVCKKLSVPLIANPLDPTTTGRVNNALFAGADFVDAMDDALSAEVFRGLDECIEAAESAGRSIDPDALLYMACWINMTGKPTTLLRWLRGEPVTLRREIRPPGDVVTAEDVRVYLLWTDYFVENPRNFQHLTESVGAGRRRLEAA